MMSSPNDLSELERWARRTQFEDGLLDIAVGTMLLLMGISAALDLAWMWGVLGAVLASLVAAAKRAITCPRIGRATFRHAPRNRQSSGLRWLALLGTMSLLLMFLALMPVPFGISSNGIGDWVRQAGGGALLVGCVVAVGGSAAAHFFGFDRGYLYAVASGLALAITIVTANEISLMLPGAVILVFGLILLARFLRNYPVSGDDDR